MGLFDKFKKASDALNNAGVPVDLLKGALNDKVSEMSGGLVDADSAGDILGDVSKTISGDVGEVFGGVAKSLSDVTGVFGQVKSEMTETFTGSNSPLAALGGIASSFGLGGKKKETHREEYQSPDYSTDDDDSDDDSYSSSSYSSSSSSSSSRSTSSTPKPAKEPKKRWQDDYWVKKHQADIERAKKQIESWQRDAKNSSSKQVKESTARMIAGHRKMIAETKEKIARIKEKYARGQA